MIRKTLAVALAIACSMAAVAAPRSSTGAPAGNWHNTVHPIPASQPTTAKSDGTTTDTASTAGTSTDATSTAKPATTTASGDAGSGDQWHNTVHPIPAPKGGNQAPTNPPPKK